MERRFELLDLARGLAALAVVFFHRGVYSGFSHPMDWIAKYGEVGANIFFVISGYVIYQSAERLFSDGTQGAITFLRKRFKRIYPTFWISLLFAFFVVVFVQGMVFTVRDILGSVTLTYSFLELKSPQVVYWTLVYEQQFYLVIAILMLPLFQRSRIWLIFASSIVAVTHTIGLLSNWWSNNLLPGHWLEFELGIIAYFIIQRRVSRWISAPTFIILVMSGLLGDYRTQAASIFACLMLLAYYVEPVLSSWRILNPVRLLGLISYSLYLTHLPIFTLSDLIFKDVFSKESLAFYLSGIISALVLGSVFFWLFERPFITSRKPVTAIVPQNLTKTQKG